MASPDGPVLSVLTKRIRALNKKLPRIRELERSLSAGKQLNPEQHDLVRSKSAVEARIEELEKLRAPLSVALDSERNNVVKDMVELMYFGSLFDVDQQSDTSLSTKTHERERCLTSADAVEEKDLDSISELLGFMNAKPVNSTLSHRDAVERCFDHAKLWVGSSVQLIRQTSDATYAMLRDKLDKIMRLDYYDTTPETKAPIIVAGGAAIVESIVGNVQMPMQVEGSNGQDQVSTEQALAEGSGSTEKVERKLNFASLVKAMAQAQCNLASTSRITIPNPARSVKPESFPMFHDGDEVNFYPEAFNLSTWMRYAGACRILMHRGRRHDHYRFKRESAVVIQSLITAVLSYLDEHQGHSRLGDPTVFTLTQSVVDLGGFKKIRFTATVSQEPENANRKSRVESIADFVKLLKRLFLGIGDGALEKELDYMLDTLVEYSYQSDQTSRALLIHYPAFWDVSERRSFHVLFFLKVKTGDGDLFWRIVNEMDVWYDKDEVDEVGIGYVEKWHRNIPKHTIYDDVFEGGVVAGKTQYPEGSYYSMYHYVRAAHQHFCDHQDKKLITAVKEKEFEDFLSSIFGMLLVKAYRAMCHCKLFF